MRGRRQRHTACLLAQGGSCCVGCCHTAITPVHIRLGFGSDALFLAHPCILGAWDTPLQLHQHHHQRITHSLLLSLTSYSIPPFNHLTQPLACLIRRARTMTRLSLSLAHSLTFFNVPLQALDKARKDLDKARKVREPLTKKLAEDPQALDSLAAEVAELQQQLAAV